MYGTTSRFDEASALDDYFVEATIRKEKKVCKVCLQCYRETRIRRNSPESQMTAAGEGHRKIWHQTFRKHTSHIDIFGKGNTGANRRLLNSSHSLNAQFKGRSAHFKPELAAGANMQLRCCLVNTATASLLHAQPSHADTLQEPTKPRSSAMSWNFSKWNYVTEVSFKPLNIRNWVRCCSSSLVTAHNTTIRSPALCLPSRFKILHPWMKSGSICAGHLTGNAAIQWLHMGAKRGENEQVYQNSDIAGA